MSSQCTHIMLAGKTGHGKSATGNSIVGHKAFKSVASFQSVTQTAQFEFGEFEGRKLKVVDGPGLFDTDVSEKAGAKLVIDATTAAVTANPIGFHTILLIIKYGGRLTKEDVKTVKILKKILGENFIKYHAILLMTCGDAFKEDNEVAFEEWFPTLKGSIKDWIDECNGRVIIFDNKTNDTNIKTEQMRKLLNMIDRLSGSGALYTSHTFDKAKQTRDNLLKKCKTPKLSDEALQECSLIRQQADRIDYNNPKEAVSVLEVLRRRADALELDIINQDQGTNSLRVAITLAQQIKELLNEKNNAVITILRLKQEMEQKQLEHGMEQSSLDEGRANREVDLRRQGDTKREAQQCCSVSVKQRRESVEDRELRSEQKLREANAHQERKLQAERELKKAVNLEKENERLKEEVKREKEIQKYRADLEQHKKVLEEEKRMTEKELKHEIEKQKLREEFEQQKRELAEESRRKEEKLKNEMELRKLQEEINRQNKVLQETLLMENINKTYEKVKEDQTWTWGDVGQTVSNYIKSWFW